MFFVFGFLSKQIVFLSDSNKLTCNKIIKYVS